MLDEIIIEHKGDYIHVRHYGRDSYDISLELWRRIVAACERYHCFNILGETHTTERLSTMDNYNHIKIFREAGVTLQHRIAWVVSEPESTPDIRFVGTVLRNRGLARGGIFPRVEDAKRWLLEGKQGQRETAADAE